MATVDDLTTTSTVSVWRDKVSREKRAQREWHYRWGEAFGIERPPSSNASNRSFRQYFEIPELPVSGVRRNNMVEPTESSLKWDSAVNHGKVPIRPPSERSLGGASRMSTKSLPPVKAMSISSSNDRRRELLHERQMELQSQLEQVEQLLQNAAPTTSMTINSKDWETASVGSRPPTGGSGRRGGGGGGPRGGGFNPLSTVMEAVPPTPPVAREAPPSEAPKMRRVPLCQDIHAETSPMISGVGSGFNLPGAAMSASFK